MAIQSGAHLGPYEIVAAIGAGGMGEVYRARDSKLARDVAIKVLPQAFARDAERMARFQREAKLLASLNHPKIAAIYGFEDSGTTHALVMELVEGPTLADRIKSGPMPVDEALRIAKQICEGLEYAHERGIVHRDLKPANVKVSQDDAVKILDFGLAKAIAGDASDADLANSPTISRMATQAGVLLGTAAYMSPEQAKGKSVDRRADIWAFGCVQYEMLTGQRPFEGESVTDTLAAVIRAEPDWSRLPSATPIRVRVLLQRCLQKDPKQRLRDIGDARISLDEVLSGAPDPIATTSAALSGEHWPLWLAWGLAGVFIVAFSALAFIHFREKPAPAVAVQRFEIVAPDPKVDFIRALLSPDGTRLLLQSSAAGTAPARLWLRRMDSLEAHPIEGTDDVYGYPFWSPDSRFIVFGARDRKLRKVDVEGGPPEVLCELGNDLAGGFWTGDGKIVFGDPDRQPGLWEVPAGGGTSSALQGLVHVNPYLAFPAPLPDGKHFLYSSGGAGSYEVYLGSLDGKEGSKKLLAADGASYVPSPDDADLGYLLFRRATLGGSPDTLMAQPFDVRKLELVGDPVPVAEQVSYGSASLSGTLVYRSGVSTQAAGQLTVFDRQGKVLGTAGEAGRYYTMAFSPDGKRVAAARVNLQSDNESLWMMDLARGISTRFTFDSGSDIEPVWSPDGNRVAFGSFRDGKAYLYQKLSNGGSDEERLSKSETEDGTPLSWSGDGRFLLIAMSIPNADAIVSVLPLDANGHAAGKPFPFVQKGVGIEERFSPGPSGRPLWVAYSSVESGRYEIYVRPFDPNSPTGTPPDGGKWQVSTQGGMSPRWNGNGKELFFVTPDGTVMGAEVSGSNGVFQSGVPKPLFKPNGLAPQANNYFFWDASPDGNKFIFAVSPSASGTPPPARFTVVLNWQAALKQSQ